MADYLIIGASSGIGKALAEQLAAEGHHIYATYNNNNQVPGSSSIEYHQVNVLNENLQLDFLPASINGMVYCPGSINLKPFDRIRPIDFVSDFELQVVGAVKIIQAVIPKLKNTKNAAIVLYSTVAVQNGLPYHSQIAASKGAIEGLTRALAAEFSPSVRVNCIAPSLTDTPLARQLLNTDQKRETNALRHPLKRIGNTSDIANMAAFLLSEKASWITGQVIHVDGGLSAIKS